MLFRSDLTGQIDFKSGTDGNQIVVLSNHGGVADEFGGAKIKHRIVVDIAIELIGSHDHGGDDSARNVRLFFVGDHLLFDQRNETVASSNMLHVTA